MCNSEAVAYAEFAESHPEWEFVGVNVADDRPSAKAFLADYGWEWPSFFDPDRELAGSLGFFGQPAVAVLDEEGRLVARQLGAGDIETWEALATGL